MELISECENIIVVTPGDTSVDEVTLFADQINSVAVVSVDTMFLLYPAVCVARLLYG